MIEPGDREIVSDRYRLTNCRVADSTTKVACTDDDCVTVVRRSVERRSTRYCKRTAYCLVACDVHTTVEGASRKFEGDRKPTVNVPLTCSAPLLVKRPVLVSPLSVVTRQLR